VLRSYDCRTPERNVSASITPALSGPGGDSDGSSNSAAPSAVSAAATQAGG